jgi:hypothetical protein
MPQPDPPGPGTPAREGSRRRPEVPPVVHRAGRGAPPNRRIRVGVDTGGTFTDVVAFDEDTGELAAIKTPTTPADPAEGFLDGVA